MTESKKTLHWLVLIWLVFSVIGMSIAYLMRDHATAPDGNIVPMSNDSFYHARRMVDAAGEYGFFEYDVNMHMPEGSWVTWPWGYDYAAGKVLDLAQTVNPDVQPMAVLGWIPTLWLAINMALFIGIAARAGLRPELIAIAALAYALSTASQVLHGFAIIDHHFLELFAFLACCYSLMRWLDQPKSLSAATTLGVVLGVVPAIHTSAFILQLLVLVTLAILWMREELPAEKSLKRLAITLVATTLINVLISEPAWNGQFTMATLSWLHAYVALCSGIAIWLLTWRAFSMSQLVRVTLICVVVGVPLAGTLLLGGQFLSGQILLLDQVEEMKSPIADVLIRGEWSATFSRYSMLIVLVPVIASAFLVSLFRKPKPASVAFFVCGLFGLLMLSLQQRLIYFGIAPLIIGSVWLIALSKAWLPRMGVALVALVVIAVAIQPEVRQQIFRHYPLGLDRDYEMTYNIFPMIEERCRLEPGLMIASSNDGHPVRYHSDCSVLTNNFILTPQHEEKAMELQRLLSMSPQAFLENMPEQTRYLFVRVRGMFEFNGDQVGLRSVEALRQVNPPLFMALAESNQAIPGFELAAELRVDDARGLPMVQVYRISRTVAAP